MRKNKLRTQILWVGTIVVVLTLMSSLILPLVSERGQRRETVLREMARIWGAPQVIAGPTGFAGEAQVDFAGLKIDGEFKTSVRRKGIYKFPLYAAMLQVSGRLNTTGVERLQIRSRARLRVEKAELGGHAIHFVETAESGGYVYKANTKSLGDETQLRMTLACEGLQSFSLVPVAAVTEVRLKSEWNDPGFFGDFLPLEYYISKEGFTAYWKLMPPQGRKWNEISVDAAAGAFGVAFYQPVDIYQASERSVKYAILFIALTLMTLLLFEMVSSAEIHPMQYFLAGLGLVVFYLLLLALAEYLGFSVAYLIAAVANVTLLSRYAASFLLSRSQGITFTLVLSSLYGLLYIILQLEEAALLSGALALFAALALAMYLTRRVNWYKLGDLPP